MLRSLPTASLQLVHHAVAIPDPLGVSQLQASIDRFKNLIREAARAEFLGRRERVIGFPKPRVRTSLHFHRVRRFPWRVAPRHHAPQHRPETVEVGPRAELSVRHLLERRVPLRVRGQRPAMFRHRLLRCSEVDQHRPLVGLTHQDVRRLDVPMDHPRTVYVSQSLRQRNGYSQQVGLRERLTCCLPLPEQLRQRQPLHVLHDQIGCPVGAEEVTAVDNAGMLLKIDQRLRLFAKAPQPVGEMGLAVRAPGTDRRPLAYCEF